MLSAEANRQLTQTGPGTLMGEMMRRYWVPALLATEVAERDGPPVQSAGQIADLGGGALMAAFGILAALKERDRSGEGQLVDWLQELGGLSSDLAAKPRWLQHYLPTIRADLCLSDTYVYRAETGLECPVHAFLGEGDRLVVREDWQAWAEIAAGEFGADLLPGGHFFSRDGQARLVARVASLLGGAAWAS